MTNQPKIDCTQKKHSWLLLLFKTTPLPAFVKQIRDQDATTSFWRSKLISCTEVRIRADEEQSLCCLLHIEHPDDEAGTGMWRGATGGRLLSSFSTADTPLRGSA